jgi:CHAT domain-containing protein
MSGLSPSLLVVAQPDEYLKGVKEELEVIRAVGIPVTGLVSKEGTRATVIQGLQKHQLVHFACHGTLKSGKSFDAGFELHDEDRLTLLDIVRSRLPVAEFAFLSACHTVELTDVGTRDEALHLTAAMQYSGFSSVVGTLWAMADTDGRDLLEHFYESMLSLDGSGVVGLFCERSGRALQGSVQMLRKKKGVTLERWVNFVHYGI